jgi:hypothetical protein
MLQFHLLELVYNWPPQYDQAFLDLIRDFFKELLVNLVVHFVLNQFGG